MAAHRRRKVEGGGDSGRVVAHQALPPGGGVHPPWGALADPDNAGRCTRNRPAEDGVEVSLPYADYYLLEGVLRVLDRSKVDRAIDLSSG
ncbi:hypothetical protein [Amycolatopsis sp. lyj-346]|uniref:hypothetical protein n=1 Tax=Amycolatopsis sp. lyj-346 TaxID=2789289 RepID=UPI00397B4D9C